MPECDIDIDLTGIQENHIMTEKRYERYYPLIGKASFENHDSVGGSVMCGCYYCCSIFPSSEVSMEDWIEDRQGMTAVCPRCHIDSVLGDAAGIPISKEALEEFRAYSFGTPGEEEVPRCVVADECQAVLPHLDAFGVETDPQAALHGLPSDTMPDCYCFSRPDEENLHTASALKERGAKVIWCVPTAGVEIGSECVEVSDAILLAGGDPADIALAGENTERLFVRTIGTHGVLYRFRNGSWNLLRPSSGDAIDFDAAAFLIAAGLVYGLSRTDAEFDTLEESHVEKILGEAMQYVIESRLNAGL